MPNLILAAFILSILVTGIQCDDIPNCDFFDTVNITDSFSNGFYTYKNVVIPANLMGEYDYVINSDGGKDPVPKHLRGCVCKLKTCIRFCCHHKKMMESDYKSCSSHINATLTYEYINVTLSNGRTVVEKHVLNEMIVQEELPLPCKSLFPLDVEQYVYDEWTLFENGSLFRHYDAIHLSKQQYCLQPNPSSTGKNYTILTAFNCIEEASLATTYVKMCSMFSMFLTILAYLLMPKFRSLHGRVRNLYFICLTLTILLNILIMFGIFNYSYRLCLIIGYAGYFLEMSTCLWLSVISFDIWRRLSMLRVKDFYNNDRSSLFNYNAFVWIIASILTIFIMLIDVFVEYDDNNPYTPGVGIFNCWVNTNNWSAMIYFYSPITILKVLNCVMFGLTSRYIYRENQSNQKQLNRIAQQRDTRNRVNYRVYLRLFIIMGGSWFLDIIAYICEMENVFTFVATFNDIIKSGQGMIISLVTFCNLDMIN